MLYGKAIRRFMVPRYGQGKHHSTPTGIRGRNEAYILPDLQGWWRAAKNYRIACREDAGPRNNRAYGLLMGCSFGISPKARRKVAILYRLLQAEHSYKTRSIPPASVRRMYRLSWKCSMVFNLGRKLRVLANRNG